MRTSKATPWILFGGSLFFFLVNLWNFDFLAIDTRFGLFLFETAENPYGFFPTLYGIPYSDYTAFPMILMDLCRPFLGGGVSMLTTVFPSALLASFTVLFTYLLGRKMFSEFSGIASALLLMSSYGFIIMARIVTLDMYIAFAVAASLYLVYTADTEKKPLRALWFFPLIVFSFAARGPIGIVVPAAVIPGYYLVTGRFFRMIFFGVCAASLMVGLFMLLAYAALRTGGPDFLELFYAMQVSDRLGSSRAPWFYLTDGLKMYAPVFPLALFAAGILIHRERRNLFRTSNDALRPIRIVLFWFFVILIGLSIPGTKHTRYLVPAIPAAAILAGRIFTDPEYHRSFRFLRDWLVRLSVYAPGIFAFGALVGWLVLKLPFVEKLSGTELTFDLAPILFGAGVLQWIVLKLGKSKEETRVVAALAVLAGILLLARISIDEPVSERLMSSRDLVKSVESLRPDGKKLYFLELGPDGDENKYMILVDRKRVFVPSYIQLLRDEGEFELVRDRSGAVRIRKPVEELLALPSGSLILARRDRWEKYVPEHVRAGFGVLTEGRLGRRDCLLLSVKSNPGGAK